MRMKNIQMIDGADNCTFSVFQATDEEFTQVFPETDQDIQFAEDLSKAAGSMLESIWQRPILKRDASGIHGTLFFEFGTRRGSFPASKRERDWPDAALNPAQRKLYRGT